MTAMDIAVVSNIGFAGIASPRMLDLEAIAASSDNHSLRGKGG